MPRTTLLTILLVFVSGSLLSALEPVTKTIDLTDAPVLIESYTATYLEGARPMPGGIYHSLSYKNVSDKIVVAVQIGLVSFNVFDEFIGRISGIAIETIPPTGSEKGLWIDRADGGSAFHTGMAYVSKVRFIDSEIWEADLKEVAAELSKIEEGFDVSKLEARESAEEEVTPPLGN